MIRHLLIAVMVMGAASVGFAGEAKKAVKKNEPQLAGIGMPSMKHTCTLSFQGCLAGCQGVSGCAEECDADCNVCALDFGEEVPSVCQK